MVELLSSIELPHWLMIAGASIIAISLVALAFSGRRDVATDGDK
jgi:hypothetical protein